MQKTARSRALRYLLLIGLLIAIVLGVRYAFFRPEAPPPPTTAEVRRGTIENTVLAAGELEAAQLVSVGAQASGQLKHLAVELGDRVKQGDLVAEIDSMTQQNALRNAEAALKAIHARRAAEQAALKQARLEFERQRQMLAQNASSRQAFEAAEASYATLQAQIAVLEAELAQAEISVDTARVNLGYTRITAPMDGTVVAVIAREGQTLNANQQAPTIIRLAQLDTLTVKAQISEADVIRVRAGMPVYFSILGDPDRRFHATLRSVEPAPDSIATESSSSSSSSSTSSSSSSAVYYNGMFDIDNPDGLLRIGMTAQVNIVLEQATDTLLVPASAVQRTAPRGPRGAAAAVGAGGARAPGRPATVRVLTPAGAIEAREVRTGIDNNINVQVLSGLELGEKVVIGSGSPLAATGQGPGQRPRMPGLRM
ncbi:MAG: efflux RND transporter periplasmic adaptor subunit [Pigmentiphaga sp.]|nr:efflux RND transporter periplasmic adaptor subunit [Pigmentiphaga sp.]